MNDSSHLVASALDSFFHALEHSESNTEKDRRFTILHLDQAIGLIIKEKVKQLGKSIWKKDKTTISIYESKKMLEKENPPILIPEWTDIEDIHQVRNNVEHFGNTPSKTQNEFYVKRAKNFIKRFCIEELKINIEDFEGESEIEKKIEKIKLPSYDIILQDSENLFIKKDYYNAFLNAFMALELAFRGKTEEILKEPTDKESFIKIITKLQRLDILNKKQIENLLNILNLRNKIIHKRSPIEKEMVEKYLKEIRKIIEILDKHVSLQGNELKSLIKKLGDLNNQDLVLVCIYGLLKYNKVEKININDIRDTLQKLRLHIPKNLNFILINLKNKGFVEVSLEKKELLTSWYITMKGENYIEKFLKK